MTREELWLRTNAIKGLGARKSAEIASYLENYLAEITPNDHTYLWHASLNSEQIADFWYLSERYIEDSLNWLQASHHSLLMFSDSRFPNQLRHISSPPTLLFVAGDERLLAEPQIAIVGSRRLSRYGEHWANHFASGLSEAGLIITSGLALGIDAVAHQATLNAQGKTIAVLGSGLANIYPKRHTQLAIDIVENGGAVISEFLSTALPLAEHFPRRNRIISGLSKGVLVIEATKNSGSLITARYALEQGRDVFAIPSALGSDLGEGTHWLIQQGAYLVTHPKDILEQIDSGLRWLMLENQTTQTGINQTNSSQQTPNRSLQSPTQYSASDNIVRTQKVDVDRSSRSTNANTEPSNESETLLDDKQILLLNAIDDHATALDIIALRVNRPVSELSISLLELEITGYIASVQGGFIRLGKLKPR